MAIGNPDDCEVSGRNDSRAFGSPCLVDQFFTRSLDHFPGPLLSRSSVFSVVRCNSASVVERLLSARLPASGLLWMGGAAFFFSLMTLFIKLTGQRLPSQQIVLVRSAATLIYSYLAARWAGVSPWGHRTAR